MTPDELARDFGHASSQVASELFDVFKETADETVEQWRENVRQVAPKHLPHLPAAITSDMQISTSIVASMGPERGRRQAALGLGDEFGSRNQAPHLNGLRAVEANLTKLTQRADTAIADLLP